jgi:hypothetical protein
VHHSVHDRFKVSVSLGLVGAVVMQRIVGVQQCDADTADEQATEVLCEERMFGAVTACAEVAMY